LKPGRQTAALVLLRHADTDIQTTHPRCENIKKQTFLVLSKRQTTEHVR
jgi:hypothetical protein